ncbi:MAG: BRO family protein, partial [Dolichospermum sp.]
RFVSHPENKFEFGLVADDIAKVLEASSGKDISRSVEDEWKGAQNLPTPGGIQSMTVIWEPGIYQLLAKSRKPQAKPFQKWLFEEVLPSIRKAGQYAVHQIPQTYSQALLEAAKLAEENERLEAQNIILERQNEQLSEAVDELFDYSSIIRVAKFNGISESRFKWHRLRAVSVQLGHEIKKVPCPRFGEKNLYSHDVWRVAYPGIPLPETNTLVVRSLYQNHGNLNQILTINKSEDNKK